ncbi:endonuclease/exonuclease/phosphatase family protein [bacterium]|nr:endonuclease/exonuclease/phosphatase family protein [bacterium]
MKVFYANILYTNTNYEGLKNTIKEENPDLVVLVEFSNEHEIAMKDFFKEDYPYVNRNSRSEKLAGDVIFSKYPLIESKREKEREKGTWDYSTVKVKIPEKRDLLNLYVVHTAAPVSPSTYEMRNLQLEKLATEFAEKKHEEQEKNMIIGDFNLSPRSAQYQTLMNTFEDLVENAFKGGDITYTWSWNGSKLFMTHIDHLFTSSNILIHDLQVKDLIGSDHRYFSFGVAYQKE